jgi:hypothetical protein
VISHSDDIQSFINDYVENSNAKAEVFYMTCKIPIFGFRQSRSHLFSG